MRPLNLACAAPVGVAVALAVAVLVGCSQRADSDPPDGRSGLVILTDHLTGCQYLSRPGYLLKPESLTPRMRGNGRQVCAPDEEDH